jgi:hypothetical protein
MRKSIRNLETGLYPSVETREVSDKAESPFGVFELEPHAGLEDLPRYTNTWKSADSRDMQTRRSSRPANAFSNRTVVSSGEQAIGGNK